MAWSCLRVLCFVLCSVLHSDSAWATQKTEAHPATLDFSRYTLVKPRLHHGREKRQISSTKDEGTEHLDHVTIKLDVENEEFILDLTLNKQLIPKGFFYRYQEKGINKVHRPTKEEIDLCHYNGKVRGKKDSWVAISTCNGLSGVIFDGKEMHYIEKDVNRKSNDLDEDHHFFYSHKHLLETNKTCGYGGDARDPFKILEHDKQNRASRYKRAAEENDKVRGPYNANKDSKYVELVLVVDNMEFKHFSDNHRKVEDHCKEIANIINGLYAPLNIFIALVGVVIWKENDEITFSSNGDTTLTNFLHYRREILVKEHPNDNAQLITKFSFENGVVGKALKGPICTYQLSGGVNNDHSEVVGLVAATIAHEMGHNFGMEHDTTECKCPEEKCIMAPSSGSVAPTHWSSCSKNYLLQAFIHGMDYCLKNKPKELFEGPVCGNGFVEHGEQCDCGLPQNCDNTCCNATTCMLHSNASCATGECCDLTTCKPKTAGTLCRSADYECDLPEYCTGHSEYCPADIFKLDTEACDGGESYCYQGFCRTRSDQCKLLWGETGMSSDNQCYLMNKKGTGHGNCGYNPFNQSYTKCNDENVLCGMLHCKHLNERLEFGMEAVATLTHSFINKNGSIIPCRTAVVDLGVNQVDPGLAPDGAKCGEGKMCVKQKCMSVASLRRQGPKCQEDCQGNGVCNSLGHCHCKEGFAPPNCKYPGPGGSLDSGPAADPNAHQAFANAMFIIFLGIIPFMAIMAFLYYYTKHNLRFGRKKSLTPASKSPSKSRQPPFPSSGMMKRNEDNHSLLHEETPAIPNEFFGNFRGFSIQKIKMFAPEKEAEPIRAAPPPPAPQTYTKSPPPVPHQNTIAAKAKFFENTTLQNGAAAAPALPPPNPGSNARPIISSPVLENSTCTAKELVSPLKHVSNVNSKTELPPPEEPKTKTGSGALNRIASFLKPSEKKPVNNIDTLPRMTKLKYKTTICKETLRSMEISNPIPQTNIEISIATLPVDAEEKKVTVTRAHSMRSPPNAKPNIQSFGSMRQPSKNLKRPLSIPNNRPKIPPPPLPPASVAASKKPVEKIDDAVDSQYDDCLNKAPLASVSEANSPQSGDNIYAVIDDTAPDKNDTFGLLGEIVSEIQNRNFDSIYSTSTLARKKKEQEERRKNEENYVNTSAIYKSPESEYSNMSNGKSSASSTSSGYIHPSAINIPVKKEISQKPLTSTFKPISPNKKSASPPSKTPSLRTRRQSPSTRRSVTNSPDLVTSCSAPQGNKSPDVIGNGATVKKPAITSAKPKIAAGKSVKPPASKSVARQNSRVSSLQQKFEKSSATPKAKT
ncbi:unnamed protein product [Brassicogethes aeneus]|uniref:Disintegrin and metalloproteinase domain-containing protein 12 n=1 Tax=Brassicogethes aeneus TaxID=1431903 RepID=A0A9P0B3F6_BRAAE|nr:unnamed protein product [Brassicogethes aeneus]